MKDKILVFVIGLLVGAVITAAGFLVYEKLNTNNNSNQMPDFSNMKAPNGQNMQMMEKPDGEPPEMPDGNMPNNNSQSSAKKQTTSSNAQNTDLPVEFLQENTDTNNGAY